MAFQIGDRVRLVSVPEPWSPTWGVVGDETIVQSLVDDCILGSTGWYWDKANIELVDTPHTDADLAMALMLATEIERDWWRVDTVPTAMVEANASLPDWLRTEVTNELLRRGGGQ